MQQYYFTATTHRATIQPRQTHAQARFLHENQRTSESLASSPDVSCLQFLIQAKNGGGRGNLVGRLLISEITGKGCAV